MAGVAAATAKTIDQTLGAPSGTESIVTAVLAELDLTNGTVRTFTAAIPRRCSFATVSVIGRRAARDSSGGAGRP